MGLYIASSYINAMLIMARDRSYSELQKVLKSKKVLIWTCNTCVKMCYGLGGTDSAERLGKKLSEDGIDVKGILSVSAACIGGKVLLKVEEVEKSNSDIVLALMCSVGTRCAEKAFGIPVINPVKTFGFGYLSSDDGPILMSEGKEKKLSDLSNLATPFV